jgi:hypothetical protein
MVVAVLLAVLVAEFLRKANEDEPDQKEQARQLAIIVVLGGFLFLPFLGSAVTHLAKSGLIPRYVLCTLLGIAASITFALRRAGSKLRLVLALFALGFVGVNEMRFWTMWKTKADDAKAYGAIKEKFIEQKGYNNLAVGVPDAIAVMPMVYYSAKPFADRLIFLTQDPDPDNPKSTDTNDLELQLYQRYSPLKVSTLDEFKSSRNAFLIYVENRYSPDWLLGRLSREGWTARTLASDGATQLYLVERNDRP